MAEGILRHLSAGSEPTTVHPMTLRVTGEMPMDISGQHSKHVQFKREPFDYVITLCDSARESCPIFPGDPERIHWMLPRSRRCD